MPTVLEKLDDLAAIDGKGAVAWADRIVFVFLALMVVSAPHSIAATQIAWLTGMAVWIVRLFMKPRVKFRFTALDAALWAFFLWSVITSLTSYAPDISINKLRGTAVFLIFYFVLYNTRTRRAAHCLAIALIVSCMVNVIWTPVQRLIGRGVEIHGVAPESPLTKARLMDGDTLLEADGKKLKTPEDVVAAAEQNETTKIKFYRPDFDYIVEVKRADLLAGNDAMSRLGITSWKKSRNWRSSGFYGHYATYSEVLQLIASLVLGLLVALFSTRRDFMRRGKRETRGRGDVKSLRNVAESQGPGDEGSASPRPANAASHNVASLRTAVSLLGCVAMMSLALLLTVTRASQLAFMISGVAIVAVGLGRKWLVAAVAIGLPIALVGVLFLQQSRQVGFFDTNDDSIKWRQTVWHEGYNLWTASPRNFLLGVGMDSSHRFAPEWHMFDDGRLNPGHFHSTPLNLVVERGLPAFLLWLLVLGIYARTLWRGLAAANPQSAISNPQYQGILLGALGGMIGFFASGFVHYNLGDQEVAMMLFLLMGLAVRVARNSETGENVS